MKETRLAIPKKRKIHISEASSVKGKEVEASKSSDKVEEKVIQRIFVLLENNDTNMYMYSDPIFVPHISVYTNTDIVSELKENLTPEQYKQLGNTCFGNFLQMKRYEVQHQLFRCFMTLQLEGTPNNVFAKHVNGTSLHFTLREFALVTGLKCVGNDADFEFSEKVPNRLIETYFAGANLVKKKHLMKCFADKNWGPDNDGDALKIALLYFIQTFIFSSEKNSTTIPRLHFDLVESGRNSEYNWGLKAFETLTKSISKKTDAQKTYYRIVGMPLAIQVWFYECCSDVDPKIALRVDNVVPRILNWRTTGNQPNFAYLMNDMFNDKANMKYTIAYRCCIHLHTNAYRCCIQDTTYIFIQMHITIYNNIQMHTDTTCKCIQDTTYICIQMHTTIVYKDIHPTDIELAVIQIPPVGVDVENNPTPAHSDKSGEDSDDFSPTPDLQCKKKHVASIGPSSSPPHKKCKEHERHLSNTEYQSKIPSLADSKNDEVSSLRKDLNSFKEYVVGEFKSLRTLINDNFKMLSDHLQHNQQNEGQEGVSTEFYVSQFELDDKFLPSQIPETRIVIHNIAKKVESTPVPSHRNRRPSRWYSSPYESNFDSAGTSVKLTPIFEKRHPFEDDSITGPHPTLIIQEYDKWVRDGLLARHDQRSNLEDHYKKNKSTLHIPLDFGVDQHIDVIFYYLRKKGKYTQTSNFKYTTVDCIFKIRIAEIFDKYADTDSNANVAKEEDVVCEYIRGYRLLANVPWHTVDNVLIPVNLKDKLYWVLAVVSFKERCIKVYDSYRYAGHDAYVASEIDKLAKLVPLHLSISGFYRDSQGIDWSTYSAYTDKSHTDPFEVFFISDLPQQKAGSMDCGVYVAAYAEFLSTLGEIPQTTFDSNQLHQRYGALIWDYAMRKIDADAISENEAPSKIARQITKSDSKLQIVLE
ncbi:uncharacterized protein LOC142165332 [Nicotiana tabacum]|uniref:Uncharacterized protein LOC142165332 n=1 Tax=Nicotiana tabacum TaxID=4097 RepID=A0AC58S4V6_TOBAC